MSTGHRFFFIISCTFLFAGAFVLGITILPIICGLRYCCARVREPEAPVKPTDPIKPTKPEEPKIGASNEEWTEYRKNMSEYRAKKTKWKEDHKYFKENQSKLILQWEKENRAHNKKVAEYKAKVVNPAKQAFCEYCTCSTTQILFCRDEPPSLILRFMKAYLPEDSTKQSLF